MDIHEFKSRTDEQLVDLLLNRPSSTEGSAAKELLALRHSAIIKEHNHQLQRMHRSTLYLTLVLALCAVGGLVLKYIESETVEGHARSSTYFTDWGFDNADSTSGIVVRLCCQCAPREAASRCLVGHVDLDILAAGARTDSISNHCQEPVPLVPYRSDWFEGCPYKWPLCDLSPQGSTVAPDTSSF